MSEKFWIQDADGKLDGSLHEVPQKGYTADGSEKECILNTSAKVKRAYSRRQTVGHTFLSRVSLK
ncbi:MAG: hypothetical protein HQK96_05380 [Nitrospirae bacterium]|nr:hypothetical protein [Nitrospirota bacterium]